MQARQKTDKTTVTSYIPKEIAPYASHFFSDEELALAAALQEGELTEDEISQRLGCDCTELLQRAYRREMVSKTVSEDGTIRYILRDAGVVINNTAVFDRELWESLPQDERDAITSWHYTRYVNSKRPMTLKEKQANGNRVLPLDVIIQYLQTKGDSFTVIPCDCHCKYSGSDCDYDKNVCICFGDGLNTHRDRGLGEVKSLAETIELLKRADHLGLVHSAEAENICNCNVKYCYPTRAAFDLNTVHQWPVTEYVVEFDEEKCLKCKLCLRRCQFGVFSYHDGRIHLDKSKCWGCGLCASTCPGKALTVRQRTSDDENQCCHNILMLQYMEAFHIRHSLCSPSIGISFRLPM